MRVRPPPYLYTGHRGGFPDPGSPIRELDGSFCSDHGFAYRPAGSSDRSDGHESSDQRLHQIGVVLLIALAAKNAILIVEFARDYRAAGKSTEESAIEGGRVRLRPILMTSFAFILGTFPLVISTGAGASSRISLGIAVFAGMLMTSLVGTLFIPNFS